MKKYLAMLFQVIIILIGIGVFAFMLWEPQIEGRNINATLFEVYFRDPFLAYAYIASIPFFVGVFQTFKLLGYIRENAAFSKNSLQGLRIIKYCAMILVVFILIPEFYLLIVRPGDDIAGGVAIGLFLIVLSGIVATISAVFEKRTRKVI